MRIEIEFEKFGEKERTLQKTRYLVGVILRRFCKTPGILL
jgi:hypothetical protein